MAGTSPAMTVGTTVSRSLVIPGRRVSAGPGIQMLARCWHDAGFWIPGSRARARAPE